MPRLAGSPTRPLLAGRGGIEGFAETEPRRDDRVLMHTLQRYITGVFSSSASAAEGRCRIERDFFSSLLVC
jgi:hypothetical protein